MNDLSSSINEQSSPRGRNTFFDYSPPESPVSPRGEDKRTKRRSIFTLSGKLPSKSTSAQSRKKSQELLNIVNEVNSMNIGEQNDLSSNKNESKQSDGHQRRSLDSQQMSSPLPTRSLPNNAIEDDLTNHLITPPTTPEKNKDEDGNAQGKQRQRHGSLENLHRPRNHRSFTNPSKLKKQRSKDSDGDSSNCSSSRQSTTSTKRVTRSFGGRLPGCSSKDSGSSLTQRAATTFAMAAVRKLSQQVSKLQEENETKKRESAARMILNSLLLNSWRQSIKQNEKYVRDNSMQSRTIENMCLQLRVIRQMHREEKDKSQSRSVQVSSMAIQISDLKAERDKIQTELENVENELNSCQLYVESLNGTNEDLQKCNNKLQKSIALLEKEKQEEMKKGARLEMAQARHQDMIQELKQQFQEESRQRVRWQEEARGKDSEIFTLKSDLESKEKQINKLRNSYQEVKEEMDHHQNTKLKLQKEKLKMREQLESSAQEIKILQEKLRKSEEDAQTQAKISEDTQINIKQKDVAIKEIRENLCLYMSEGIERRRRWANAFHYLVFPFDIIRLIFDLPKESCYAVDLGQFNAECKVRGGGEAESY